MTNNSKELIYLSDREKEYAKEATEKAVREIAKCLKLG